jgi:predicted dehydrogenase
VNVPDLGPDWEIFSGGWNETLELVGDRGYIRVSNPSWEGVSAIKTTHWYHEDPGPAVEYFDSGMQWANEVECFAQGIKTGRYPADATTAMDAYRVDFAVSRLRSSAEMGGKLLEI